MDLYRKNHKLLLQEQKLVAINKSLELEINERKISEEKIKELNRQLLENIARLESANKDLDLFAFMASHDLQAPLRKIRLFSDRLLLSAGDKLDDDIKSYINRIQQVCKGMQELINDILEFSRISVEKNSFEEVDLNVLVHEVVTEMDGVIHEKNAKITIDELPSLKANPGLLRPLFSNLLSNALKYCKKDVAPVIQIRSDLSGNATDKKDADTRYCRIYIEDNGIGFDQKYAEQAFEMFRRLHPNVESEGTGIGLALCKKIVEKHSGYISAISKVNEGATFIISLPLHLS